jgi:hypothetical protein
MGDSSSGPATNEKMNPNTGKKKTKRHQKTLAPMGTPLLRIVVMAQISAKNMNKTNSPATMSLSPRPVHHFRQINLSKTAAQARPFGQRGNQ